MAINFNHKTNAIETPDGNMTSLKGKNVIINGNFDVWQRDTSFAAASAQTYTADRFEYIKNGSMAIVHTVARSTDVPTYAQSGITSSYSLHCDVTTADTDIAAGDYCSIDYIVEGYDFARLQGGDATLSFWVKAAKTGVHCVAFRNSGSDRSYVMEYSVAAADTWEKVEITIPFTADGTWLYDNGKGVTISWTLAVGSTYQTTKDAWQTGNYIGTSSQVNELDNVANNFRIAQVQLEKGSVATPFEFRSYAEELALCQRYYQFQIYEAWGVIGTGRADGTVSVITDTKPYAVEMRATPAFSSNGEDVQVFHHDGTSVTSASDISQGFSSNKYRGSTYHSTNLSGLTANASYTVGVHDAAVKVYLDAEL